MLQEERGRLEERRGAGGGFEMVTLGHCETGGCSLVMLMFEQMEMQSGSLSPCFPVRPASTELLKSPEIESIRITA